MSNTAVELGDLVHSQIAVHPVGSQMPDSIADCVSQPVVGRVSVTAKTHRMRSHHEASRCGGSLRSAPM